MALPIPSSFCCGDVMKRLWQSLFVLSLVIRTSAIALYKDTQSGKYVSVDEKSGGGVTQGALGGSQLIVISGNENKSLKDTSGAPLKDTAAYILAHEVVGHAVPMMTGNAKGNAVDDENKVRSEVPGGGQRQAEPDHEEGGR